MSARLAALGIKRSIQAGASSPLPSVGLSSLAPDAAAAKPRKRRLASPASFPKGRGVKSSLAEDLSTSIPVQLASASFNLNVGADDAAAKPGAPKLSALERRMAKSRKEILTVTENAAGVIKRMMARRKDTPLGVRVGVKTKGCNGLAYTMDYLYPEALEEHSNEVSRHGPTSTTQHGVTVLVDPDAFMHVVGTVMDYQIDKASEKFVFLNPNAVEACGCGESFVTAESQKVQKAAHNAAASRVAAAAAASAPAATVAAAASA